MAYSIELSDKNFNPFYLQEKIGEAFGNHILCKLEIDRLLPLELITRLFETIALTIALIVSIPLLPLVAMGQGIRKLGDTLSKKRVVVPLPVHVSKENEVSPHLAQRSTSCSKEVAISPDGNCLFNAVGYWLEPKLSAEKMRKDAIEWIEKQNIDNLMQACRQAFVELLPQREGDALYNESGADYIKSHLPSYLDAMRSNGSFSSDSVFKGQRTYGGALELYALSKFYQINIQVWQRENGAYKKVFLFEADTPNRPAAHILKGGLHYDVYLPPKPRSDSSSS